MTPHHAHDEVAAPKHVGPERLLFPEVGLLRAKVQTVLRLVGDYSRLKPGDQLDAVTESWMVRCPTKIVPIARIEVVSVRKEPLRALLSNSAYAETEMTLEGVPRSVSVKTYVARFISRYSSLQLDSDVTRIEFKYL